MYRPHAILMYGAWTSLLQGPELRDHAYQTDGLVSYIAGNGVDPSGIVVGLESTAVRSDGEQVVQEAEIQQPDEDEIDMLREFLSRKDIDEEPRWLLFHNMT